MSELLRILILEDRATDAELMVREIRRAGFTFQCRQVETEADFLAALEDPPDVILSDYSLPRFDGVRALSLLRERGLDIPFILVSGKLGEESAVEAMKRGATDYLIKDRIVRLGPAIERALEEKRLRHERRKIEQSLREAEQKYRSIFENAVEGIYLSTPEGRYLAVNPAMARIFGYASPSEMVAQVTDIGRQIYVQPEYRTEFQRLLRERGRVENFEHQARRKDGGIIWIEQNARIVTENNGQTLCYEGSIQDITECRRLEEELRQSQKMEAIGQLAGGVAHDFNNIIATISLRTELLLEKTGDKPDAISDGLREIRGSAERAANLTRQLLLFGRRQVMQPHELDLNQVVSSFAKMLQRIIGEDLHLNLELHPRPLITYADAGMLEQILMNLGVNARDAMPNGGQLFIATAEKSGPEDFTRLHRHEMPGDYVCLTVSDSGLGISSEILPHIFEPFFTTKGAGKGTGLGLSMVHGLAAQSGGALHLSSRPGAGTTAELWLPRAKGLPATIALPAAAPPQQLRPCTILLVDDDALISMATSEMLKDLGHRVIESPSGSKALEVLRTGTAVDVVITDQAMPGMTGTQLAAEIRAAWPDLPVIIATGYAELPEDRDRKLPRLDKPYGQDDLAAAIERLLGAGTTASP
jgi:PAS domain S-box-containing protein